MQDGMPRVGVVGARAEAALPVHLWRELAVLSGAAHVAVEMCGPACCPPGVARVRACSGLELALAEPAGFFHASPTGRALLRGAPPPEPLPDAFVLFNPGLGEPGWERAWGGTLAALAASQRPLLFTALSAADAARDDAFLRRAGVLAGGELHVEPYVVNAWASALVESDGTRSNGLWRALPAGTLRRASPGAHR